MKADELLSIDGVTPEMAAMVAAAYKSKMVLYAVSQNAWFLPEQLVVMWKDGRFRWKPNYFEVKHPQLLVYALGEKLNGLADQIEETVLQRNAVIEFMTKK